MNTTKAAPAAKNSKVVEEMRLHGRTLIPLNAAILALIGRPRVHPRENKRLTATGATPRQQPIPCNAVNDQINKHGRTNNDYECSRDGPMWLRVHETDDFISGDH